MGNEKEIQRNKVNAKRGGGAKKVTGGKGTQEGLILYLK